MLQDKIAADDSGERACLNSLVFFLSHVYLPTNRHATRQVPGAPSATQRTRCVQNQRDPTYLAWLRRCCIDGPVRNDRLACLRLAAVAASVDARLTQPRLLELLRQLHTHSPQLAAKVSAHLCAVHVVFARLSRCICSTCSAYKASDMQSAHGSDGDVSDAHRQVSAKSATVARSR
jgi:hypothetical protein